jgi:hypothetical protein
VPTPAAAPRRPPADPCERRRPGRSSAPTRHPTGERTEREEVPLLR